MTKRAIVYGRVSTDEQAKTGYSLPTQLEACQAYAENLGFCVPAELVITDDYSGAKLHRPGLDQVRAALEAPGQAQALVVYSSDRLTRNLAHLILLREEWQRAGVELHFVNRGKSEDSPESRMTENMEGVFNDYWREKILESSMRGKRAKARAGKWVGGGQSPYGYVRRGKGAGATLVVLEREARIVRQIFAWYTGAGGKMPVSSTAIAARLTAGGVPTPSRGSKGRGWFRDTVRCVLINPAYIGELRYAGTLLEAPELAIVERHQWAVAQEQLARNKLKGARARKREYLLAGHLRCACRKALIGITRRPRKDGREYTYYACGAQWASRHMTECRARSVPLVESDDKVWAWVAGLLASEDNIRAGLRRLAERQEIELAPKRARLALLDELIAQTASKVERWLAEFGDESDSFLRDVVRGKVRETTQVLADLRAERAVLAADLAQGALAPEDEQRILELAAELRAGIAEADFETKRYLLGRLDVQGVLAEDAGGRWLACTCAVPGWQEAVILGGPAVTDASGSCGRAPPASRRGT